MQKNLLLIPTLILMAAVIAQANIFDDIAKKAESVEKTVEKTATSVTKSVGTTVSKTVDTVGTTIKKGVDTTVSAVTGTVNAVEAEIAKDALKAAGALASLTEQKKSNPAYRQYVPAALSGNQANVLNVLTWNLYMRPHLLYKNGQPIRAQADMIPTAIGSAYDVVIFNEAFDDQARTELIAGMKAQGYAYMVDVLAPKTVQEKAALEMKIYAAAGVSFKGIQLTNGGVMLFSKHPIITSEDNYFAATCGASDCLAYKGWIYAVINKLGKKYHIIATHTQAWPEQANVDIRNKQFDLIANYINGKNIPTNEPVIIGGDLNVDRMKYPAQHTQMIQKLGAKQPTIKGHPYTWDSRVNSLADQKGQVQEYLDYILYSTAHQQPKDASNTVIKMESPKLWKEYVIESYYNTLSDHFPVHGAFNFNV